MEEAKHVTMTLAGGTARIEDVEIYPGDSVEQVAIAAAPQFDLPTTGSFQILHNGTPVQNDLYKVVKDGDELTLVPKNTGGAV